MTTPKPASAPPADALRQACEGLLAFIRERYPQDFVQGGRGYICPHHIAIAEALAASAQVREGEPKYFDDVLHPDDPRRSNNLAAEHPVVRPDSHGIARGYVHPDIEQERWSEPRYTAEPMPCTAADDTPSKSRANRIALEKGESVAVAEDIARFDFTEGGFEDENERGHYVRYADHARIVAELRDSVDVAQQEIDELRLHNSKQEASLAVAQDVSDALDIVEMASSAVRGPYTSPELQEPLEQAHATLAKHIADHVREMVAMIALQDELNAIANTESMRAEAAEASLAACRALLEIAKCPNEDCVDGAYHGSNGEPCQCQWCHERDKTK